MLCYYDDRQFSKHIVFSDESFPLNKTMIMEKCVEVLIRYVFSLDDEKK